MSAENAATMENVGICAALFVAMVAFITLIALMQNSDRRGRAAQALADAQNHKTLAEINWLIRPDSGQPFTAWVLHDRSANMDYIVVQKGKALSITPRFIKPAAEAETAHDNGRHYFETPKPRKDL